jgi:hypothetical protein
VHLTTEDRDTDDHLLQSQRITVCCLSGFGLWNGVSLGLSLFEQTGKLPLLRPDQRPDFKTWAQGPNN